MIVECPHCKEKVDVSALTPGTQSSCPNCQGVFVTPDIPTAVPVIQPDAPPRPAGPPPKTSGLAVASLVLSILGFFTAFIGIGIIFALIGLIMGIVAMSQIKARPNEQGGYGLALAGTILGSVSTFFAVIGVLALIAIPNFISLRARAYDASAKSAGRNAKLSQEVWFNEAGGDISGSYTSNLSDLLVFDRNLTDDTDVTFIFGDCNSTGYTFTTQHANGGDTTFEYTD
jgi:Tfp pilus assembly protein PilE